MTPTTPPQHRRRQYRPHRPPPPTNRGGGHENNKLIRPPPPPPPRRSSSSSSSNSNRRLSPTVVRSTNMMKCHQQQRVIPPSPFPLSREQTGMESTMRPITIRPPPPARSHSLSNINNITQPVNLDPPRRSSSSGAACSNQSREQKKKKKKNTMMPPPPPAPPPPPPPPPIQRTNTSFIECAKDKLVMITRQFESRDRIRHPSPCNNNGSKHLEQIQEAESSQEQIREEVKIAKKFESSYRTRSACNNIAPPPPLSRPPTEQVRQPCHTKSKSKADSSMTNTLILHFNSIICKQDESNDTTTKIFGDEMNADNSHVSPKGKRTKGAGISGIANNDGIIKISSTHVSSNTNSNSRSLQSNVSHGGNNCKENGGRGRQSRSHSFECRHGRRARSSSRRAEKALDTLESTIKSSSTRVRSNSNSNSHSLQSNVTHEGNNCKDNGEWERQSRSHSVECRHGHRARSSSRRAKKALDTSASSTVATTSSGSGSSMKSSNTNKHLKNNPPIESNISRVTGMKVYDSVAFDPVTGCCHNHPNVCMAIKNKVNELEGSSGGGGGGGCGWKVVRTQCPKCTYDY